MAEKTKIEWTGPNGKTFSPWLGCKPKHTGCLNCYAQEYFRRFGIDGVRRLTAESSWKKVLTWNRKAEAAWETWEHNSIAGPGISPGEPENPKVFPSLCDPFEDFDGRIVNADGRQLCIIHGDGIAGGHEGYQYVETFGRNAYVSLATLDDVRRDFFRLIDETLHLDWLLLTKRPENIRRMWPADTDHNTQGLPHDIPKRLDNCWLMYSASDQETLDAGWQHLIGAAPLVPIIGWSLEPLIGPIDCNQAWRNGVLPDWVIVGGESGPNARPCDVEWIRSIVQQCLKAGVPCFVKQVGSNAIDSSLQDVWANGEHHYTRLPGDPLLFAAREALGYTVTPHKLSRLSKHPKGGDPKEWPEDIRVQQTPGVTRE